jgi:Family of unknown function (DUF5906)
VQFYDAVQLFDMGFGPHMVPVTPPDCTISPSSSLHPKHRGKAPGVLTQSGWTSLDVNNAKFRCHDYATAKLWCEGWGANTGFAAGDGRAIIDNDQGEAFSLVLRRLLANPLRRYVQDPKHTRDAFFIRVIDFVGDGVPLANQELKFRNGLREAKVSILAKGKQSVIAGVHPETRSLYGWSREIASLDDIPVMTVEQFNSLLECFVEDVGELGWTLNKPLPPSVSAPGAENSGNKIPPIIHPQPVSAPSATIGVTTSPLTSQLDEARALLAQIPNRDILPNITVSPVDEWLDDYANWVSVAYALIAFLGPLATDPEAEALWCEWSDGRTQIKQNSASVWRSALGQPTRFQALGLIKLVRSLVRPVADFPDIDPNDPALKSMTPIWDRLQANWAFCAVQGFVDMKHRRVIRRQAFSDKFAYLAGALKQEVHPSRKGPSPVTALFLSRPDRQEVLDLTYAPGDPVLVPTDDPKLPMFNLWRATAIQAQSVPASDIQPWLDHLLFVLGSDIERARFLRWSAFVVQHPELKPNWCFLVMSDQGYGKDTMTKPLKLATGEGNWREELYHSLAEDFDYALECKLLIIGETAQPKQERARGHDLSTRLKPLLARPPENLPINKKGLHPYLIPNRLAVILFSNEENPIQLERGQRRIHVVNRLAKQVQSPGYYEQLNGWLDSGGAELAASYLLAYPLTQAEKMEFIGGVAPESDDKLELEQLNTHPQLATLEDLISDARHGIKSGTPFTLVACAEDLSDMIRARGAFCPSPQAVRAWLLDMERRKTGVRRLRIDPKEPNKCGVVSALGYSARLWLLAENTSDGRAWSALTTAEIIAIWKNLPPLKNAKVMSFPNDSEGTK